MPVWAVCSAIGIVILALPDSEPRLVWLSDAHGPTAVDAVSIALLLLGWAALLRGLWQRRSLVRERAGSRTGQAAACGLGGGTGLIVASAMGDFPYWWLVGAILLLAIQIAAVGAVTDCR